MALKVCVVGSPSCRKSTVCDAVNVNLKMRGIKSEVVKEYAREYIDTIGLPKEPWEQVLIYEGQKAREDAVVKSGKDVVLCDSATFLNMIYLCQMLNNQDKTSANLNLQQHMYRKYLNGFLDYDIIFYAPTVGENIKDGTRVQTDSERIVISELIKSFMDLHGVKYITLPEEFQKRLFLIEFLILNKLHQLKDWEFSASE